MNTNKPVNTGFNLSDGSYAGENNMLKTFAEDLQEGGNRINNRNEEYYNNFYRSNY
ncbi:MAG: hypothetical protein LBI72_09880 [Flavobacteriaceae bacterium]|nr:hypothetical protein [Flavobacteriaceae bacterium]